LQFYSPASARHWDRAVYKDANGLIAASRAKIPVLITRSMFFWNDDFSDTRCVLDDLSGLGWGHRSKN
jgi:hypothetical protein